MRLAHEYAEAAVQGEEALNFEQEHAAGPLAGLKIAEVLRSDAACPAATAVAFAGMIAAAYGCSVTSKGDVSGFEPALARFLGRGKRLADKSEDVAGCILLTNDPELAAGWTGLSSVLVTNARGSQHRHSELTLQAESGLLDIIGAPGQAPLPLPGNQIAYAGGMAAFNAVVAGWNSHLAGRKPQAADVSLLDVALWLNWKHYLAANRGEANPGIGRAEEWNTVRCADGHVALVFQDKDMAALAELTGDDFFRNPELTSRATRKAHGAEFQKTIESWAAPKTRAEIAEFAQAARLPIGPVLDLQELVVDRQLRQRDVFGADGFPRLPLLIDTSAAASSQARRAERLDTVQ